MKALLKLSGELLKGSEAVIDRGYLDQLARVIKQAQTDGHQLAIVVGGGNLFRFATHADASMNPELAHARGMVATIYNGLWLLDSLRAADVNAAIVTSAFADERYVPAYEPEAVRQQLDAGTVVILSAGTGRPGPSTDSGSVQLAAAANIDMILKATHTVDGVYSADPANNPAAKRYDTLPIKTAIDQQLGFMDLAALKAADAAGQTIIVFNGRDPENLTKVLAGETIGSTITSERTA